MKDDVLYLEMSQEEYDSLTSEEIEMIIEFINKNNITLKIKKN